jgi:hypothetical protein
VEVLALLCVLLSPPVGAAGREGTVAGTLTLNGVPVAIAHVYATAEPGFFDPTKEDVHVLLSDAALSDEERADVFALQALAREGRLRAVEVVIDADGAPIAGSLFAKEFEGMVSATGMHRFTRERLDRTGIAGRLAVEEPHAFMGVTFQYEARFTAPIPRPPTPEERAAQLRSPAAQAAAAYVAAIHTRGLATFIATLSAEAATDYRGPDGAAKLGALADDMPDDARVVSLVPQTDGSVLASVEGHRAADGMVIAYTLRMVEEGGAWKVGR